MPLESPLAYVFIQSSDCKSYINEDYITITLDYDILVLHLMIFLYIQI